jgi:hypothetical protein
MASARAPLPRSWCCKRHAPPRASLRVASCRISTSTLPGGSWRKTQQTWFTPQSIIMSARICRQYLVVSNLAALRQRRGHQEHIRRSSSVPTKATITWTYRTTLPRMKQLRTDICTARCPALMFSCSARLFCRARWGGMQEGIGQGTEHPRHSRRHSRFAL